MDGEGRVSGRGGGRGDAQHVGITLSLLYPPLFSCVVHLADLMHGVCQRKPRH